MALVDDVPWKLAPEVSAMVVFGVVWCLVMVGLLMVVFRCIVVPVPKLAPVPYVLVVVAFALFRLLGICVQHTPDY